MALVGVWNSFVLAFVAAAAIADLHWRKIPRSFSIVGLIVGLGYHAIHGTVLSALAAATLGFLIGLALFRIGAIGGGDVKLLVALGALLGLQRWVLATEIAILAAALMGITQALYRHALGRVIANMGKIAVNLATFGLQPHPEINVRNPAMIRAPFGVAAAVGTFVALMLR
jgi:prepilin peptidase CpaA